MAAVEAAESGAAGRPRLGPRLTLALGLALVALGIGLVLVPTLTHGRSTSASDRSPCSPGPRARRPLTGFGEIAVTVTDGQRHTRELCMLAALTSAQQNRGLMRVRDRSLGGYDGMLFVFEGDVDNGFWMRNTPMPLSIAYVDRRGRTVSQTDMKPCADEPDCTTYPAPGPYRYAVEVPKGRLGAIGLGPNSVLRVELARPTPPS